VCPELPRIPSGCEHLHAEARRQAVGEDRPEVLEGNAVVPALMLLPVPGLGNKSADSYSGATTGQALYKSGKGLRGRIKD